MDETSFGTSVLRSGSVDETELSPLFHEGDQISPLFREGDQISPLFHEDAQIFNYLF